MIAAAGAGWWAWTRTRPDAATGGPGGGGPVALRTATATRGKLQHTIRLTGVTTPERFSSLLVPQLRGGRGGSTSVTVSGGGGRMTVSVSSSGGGGGGSTSGSSGSSSSTSSSAASSSSASATAGLNLGSTEASSSGGSSSGGSTSGGAGTSTGFRASSNRFGAGSSSASSARASSGSSSGTSSSRSSGGSAAAAAASMGQGGFGGPDAGSMSGGASDFMQVLQNVAPAGKPVTKGQVVAEFDRQYQLLRLDDYRSTVEQNERSFMSLDANLEVQRKAHDQSIYQAKAAVDKAKLDVKTIPVRSQIESEVLRLQLEEAEARLKQLEKEIPHQRETERTQRRIADLQMAQSRTELKRAEQNVDKMLVTAPMNGLLVMETTRRGSEFAQIQQGDQLFPGQMFARIVDTSSMLVAATVNQTDVERLRINASATLHFDAYPELTLPAHVVSIGAIANSGGFRAAFVKEIPVYLKLDKVDARVIPDLTVSVDVIVESSEESVVVPLESVFTDEQGKKFVYVKSAAGFERRAVELGLRNHVRATVKSGLSGGEVVAAEPPAQPQPPKRTARWRGGGQGASDV